MSISDTIKSRRSVRKYTDREIDNESVEAILEAARWAPSGLNNQPWRFIVIRNQAVKEKLSDLTHYKNIMTESKLAIAVFYNTADGYNRDKDLMSIGAAIQNMLLKAHDLGLGAVWLGEILNQKEKVSEILLPGEKNELVAVVAFGYGNEKSPGTDKRKEISEILIKYI